MKSLEPVKLRRRKLSTGRVSLYLDIYWNGKREYEYLRLYLVPERTREDKTRNKETLAFAKYLGSARTLYSRVRKPLSDHTRALYLSKLRTCVRKAMKAGIIDRDPTAGLETRKPRETERRYLTLDEVRKLAANRLEGHERICDAFLFSCLTGIRWSDIVRLRWDEVSEQGGYTRVVFRQRKTGAQEYLDISRQAAALLGARGEGPSLVFGDIGSATWVNHVIGRWVARTGIGKHITFHCARHTFAVLMLDLDTDIYTVSKLLGHKNVTTTQVYAKVLDKNKRKAVDKIPDIFSDD